MAEEIDYKVKIDTSDATNSINNLNNSVQNVGKSSSALDGIGSKLSGIKGPVGAAVQSVQGFGKALLVLAANPVVLTITAIVTAVTALVKAFTSTKEGGEKVKQLMAGLGAVMDVLRDTLLKVGNVLMSIFENPQQAIMDFADLIKTNITNRFEGLLELLPQLGKAINLLFEGEFKEAGKVATNAVSKVALGVEDVTGKLSNMADGIKAIVKEASSEAKIAANIEKSLQRIADAERNLGVERAKQNKDLAAARLQMEDENATLQERIEALKKVGGAEEQLAQKELKLAQQKANAIKARNALSDSSKEQLQEEADAQARVYELEAQSLMRQRKTSKAIESLTKEDAAKKKEQLKEQEEALKAAAEAEKARLEELQKKNEDAINQKIDAQKIEAYNTIQNEKDLQEALFQLEVDRTNALIESRKLAGLAVNDLEVKNAQALAEHRLTIEKQAIADREEMEKKAGEARIAIAQSVTGALTTLSGIVGEQTAAGKTLAVASAIIDTYMGANKALAAGAGTPVGYINAATIIATGLANVRKITSVPVPGSSDTASATPIGPSVSIVGGSADPSAQIARSLAQQNQKPIKAYAVATDMSTQQALDRRIQQNATFPG
jgi:hypothetical protein